jgi:sugar lactone lactonase YvrE
MKRTLIALLVAATIPALVWAGKIKVWQHHQPTHFEKARLTGAVLNSEGTLQLGHAVRPIGNLDAAHIWRVLDDGQGNLIVATGNEGKIFRVSPDGAATVLFQSEDSQVLSLALRADGMIYAGTGPSGQIIAIPPKGPAKVVAKTGEQYIWALTLDKAGTLFAATGPNGRIVRFDPATEKVTTHYQTKQEHVLCLTADGDGNLYVGTGSRGMVYRVDAQGKGFVLFEAPQAEVRTLTLAKGGNGLLWVGTGVPSARRTPGVTTSGSTWHGVAAASDAKTESTRPAAASESSVALAASKQAVGSATPSVAKPTTAPAPTPPGEKENSVYLLHEDGRAVEFFRAKLMVLGLAQRDDDLLIATGGDGQLIRVNTKSRERTELARVDHTQIHCLLLRQDQSLVLGTGDPGKLYALESRFAAKGTIISDVLDAKLPARWGAMRWHATLPDGTRVSVATRSGNVSTPDDTWSDWSAEQTDPDQARVASPSARFLQYRVTLNTDRTTETPSVRNLTIRYQNGNLPPEVTSIDVPTLDAANTDGNKKIKLKWKATDANEDELTYTLFVRKEGWPQWVEIASDLEKMEFEWDTSTTPPGVYELKVVASDAEANAPAEALTNHRLSAPFTVDHVAPSVKARAVHGDDGVWTVEAAATDEHSRLASAAYAIDSGKWTNAFPVEGMFDAKARTFKFTLPPLKPGAHVIVFRVTDAAGNVGTADIVVDAK